MGRGFARRLSESINKAREGRSMGKRSNLDEF